MGALVTIKSQVDFFFGDPEFAWGALAGNQSLAIPLFLTAPFLMRKRPWAAALSMLAACWWSLPVYVYLLFPRPFREYWPVWPSRWESPVVPKETFVWNSWWATGLLVNLIGASLAVVLLARRFSPRSAAL